VGCSLLLSAGASRAVDPPRFGNVPFTPFNGQVVARAKLDDRPATQLARIDLRGDLDKAWKNARSDIEKMLGRQLGGRKLGPVQLYDVSVGTANGVGLEVMPLADGAVVRMTARGNSVTFKSTTPDLDVGPFGKIGLSRVADPKVRLDFDAEVEVFLQVGADGSASARVRSARVTNIHSRGANVTGWLAHAVADVVKFFGGPDLRGLLQRTVEQKVNENVAPAVSALRVAVRQKLPTLPVKPSYVMFGTEGNALVATLYARTKPVSPSVIK
jgi:hypothetical protein